MEMPIAKKWRQILKIIDMVTFYVEKDFETPANAGANGFQLSTVRLLSGEADVTKAVDVGKHLYNDDELKDYLSTVFNLKTAEIDISE